jgi:hypothetical protein
VVNARHFLAEVRPEDTLAAVLPFLAEELGR